MDIVLIQWLATLAIAIVFVGERLWCWKYRKWYQDTLLNFVIAFTFLCDLLLLFVQTSKF